MEQATKTPQQLTAQFETDVKLLDDTLGGGRNYEISGRELRIGGRRAHLYFLDGYGKDDVIERILAFLLSLTEQQLRSVKDMDDFASRFGTYGETGTEQNLDAIVTSILLGKCALLLEGMERVMLFDAKAYPTRGVEEPSDGKVLRGSHDGFTEVVKKNSALIRRRIRDPRLVMENHRVGERSQADVVLCYLDDRVDREALGQIRERLDKIDVYSISMGQESIAEAMHRPQWFNPFPRVRYTERPDAAAASVMEGSIILMVDNSPSVMILPTSFFDFMQETNDYYFPPLVGTYLRMVRFFVFLASLVITPVWYLAMMNPEHIPSWLAFIGIEEPNGVPLLLQLLLLELIVDLLKLASLNTPDVLSNSFSMLGALILGDFAVRANWLVPEVLVYIAFVTIASFAQPSFELGYAFKLMRVVLLILSALFSVWGFLGGLVLMAVLIATTRPLAGHYLYPLYPFNWKALKHLLLRQPISRDNT